MDSAWERIIDEFCIDMKTEQNFRDNSIKAYRRKLIKMVGEFDKLDILKPIEQITEMEMKFWKTHLLAKKLSHNTIRHQHSIVKKFFYWYANKYRLDDPCRTFRPIPEEIKDPFVPTPSEVAQMIVNVGTDTFHRRRNAAIIALFAGTGIRLSEICMLNVSDIIKKEDSFEVHIPMKKTRSRRVPFGDIQNVDILASTFGLYYLQIIAQGVKKNDPLFFSINNDMHKNSLRPRTIQSIINKYGVVSSMKKLSPVELRHFFATYLYLAGEDLRTIQRYMGHALLTTTERYIYISQRIKSNTHRLHPLNKFKRPELNKINQVIQSF